LWSCRSHQGTREAATILLAALMLGRLLLLLPLAPLLKFPLVLSMRLLLMPLAAVAGDVDVVAVAGKHEVPAG